MTTAAVWTAGLAALVALGVGLVLGGLLARRGGLTGRSPAGSDQAALPPELDAVISLLRTPSLVLGTDDAVLRASPSAHALGLVRAGRVVSPAVVALARRVRAEGGQGEIDLEVAREAAPGQRAQLGVRAASLGGRVVLVVVEDRTTATRIDEMRRDFVANVSHELKTPVGAMALLAEAIAEGAADEEAVRRFAARMQRESRRLGELVKQIIELSRLQYDDPLEAPEVVLVDDVVEDALDRVRVDAQAKQIDVATGGEAGLTVLGSREQLAVALGNLVENAVTYSAPQSRVAVGVRLRDDSVEVSVTDRGIGIPESDLDRVFERFYRLDPARSRNTGGSGLGLSIVKHVAATHGGQVTAWSVEGTGSTFTLRLPAYRPAPGTTTSPLPVPEATS